MALQEEIKSSHAYHVKGPVSLGIKAGDFIYLSSQLPFDPETKVLVSDDFAAQADQCLRNIEVILNDLGLNLNYVLKTTVFVTDLGQYETLNEIYSRHFRKPYPARSFVGVSQLPFSAKIAIEAMAVDTRALEVILESEKASACEEGCCTLE